MSVYIHKRFKIFSVSYKEGFSESKIVCRKALFKIQFNFAFSFTSCGLWWTKEFYFAFCEKNFLADEITQFDILFPIDPISKMLVEGETYY